MITTPELIDLLAANAPPVRPLRPPATRALAWLLFSVLILVFLAIGHGVRPDLSECLQNALFLISVGAGLLTGALAAIASFMISLPDRSRLWQLMPVPALSVWVVTIGYGCLTDWVSLGSDGIRLGETARCLATLILTSVPLSLAMVIMLRRGALLRPRATLMTGSLAVAAITATALSLFHSLDATMMILIWNFGTAALIVGLGGIVGRRMFSWVAPRSMLR